MSSAWFDDYDLARERREDLRRDDVAAEETVQADDEQAEADRP